FRGINRVLPGETIVVSDGRIIERRRRAALSQDAPLARDVDDALATLDGVLEDSVRVHQRSDVPYGMFLSGGLGSSVVLGPMARLNPRPVTAFPAWVPDSSVADERQAAEAVARSVGANHIEVAVREQDFWSELPKVAAALDDPVADYACVPTYLLGARA